jgi:hypothetical protein
MLSVEVLSDSGES